MAALRRADTKMAEIRMSREEELVAFFVQRCGGDGNLGRTRLMKLLYLADYEARRFLGRPLSGAKYVWHLFGPWDPRLPTWINRLKGAAVLEETPVGYPSGKKGFLFTPGAKQIPLEMNIVDNAKARELSASLEVLLERRRQLRAREHLSHADAMIELEQK